MILFWDTQQLHRSYLCRTFIQLSAFINEDEQNKQRPVRLLSLVRNSCKFSPTSPVVHFQAKIGTDFPKQYTLSAAEHFDQPHDIPRSSPEPQQPLRKQRAAPAPRPPRAPVITRSCACHAAAAARRIAAAGDEPARVLKERQSS